jgi:hypothetical protein
VLDVAKPLDATTRPAAPHLDTRVERDTATSPTSRASRHRGPLTMAAAAVVPILYLLFVDHYAVNSFLDDDWSVVPIVHAALRGHLSFGLLWNQYYESRLLLGNVIDVLFGFVDRLDVRAMIMFDAVVFIAAYAVLLVLVRKYLRRRLGPLMVLALGAIWFSLADVQNTFTAFQGSWYLTVLLFMSMLCVLIISDGRRPLLFAGAVVLALAASLSTVQGFLCWPIGAIIILWPPRSRRRRPELGTWALTMLVTMAVYLRGYKFNAANTCLDAAQCTTHYELRHPLTTFGFFFGLIGNVIPGQQQTWVTSIVHDPARFVLLGMAIFAVAVFIVVQSWRLRAHREHTPLPAVLIVFSLLFDVTIAAGRGGTGTAGAVSHNRYVMANLILLTGIFIYGLARVPLARRRWVASRRGALAYVPGLVLTLLAMFLAVQVVCATSFGITNARSDHVGRILEAQLFVSEVAEHALYVTTNGACQRAEAFFVEPEATLRDASKDRLGEFNAGSLRYFQSLPVPAAIAPCLAPQ